MRKGQFLPEKYAIFPVCAFVILTPFSIILSDMALFILTTLFIFHAVKEKEKTKISISPSKTFPLFLTASFFSVIFSYHPVHSLLELKHLRSLILPVLAPLFPFKGENRRNHIIISFAVSGLSCSLLTLLSPFFSHEEHIFYNFFRNSGLTLMSEQTMLLAIPSFIFLTEMENRFHKILGYAGIFTVFLTGLINYSFNFIITLSLITLANFFIFLKERKYLLPVLSALYLVILFVKGFSPSAFPFHIHLSDQKSVIEEAKRLSAFEPIFGTGYNSFDLMSPVNIKRAYSDAIHAYVNMGIVGVTSLMLFFLDLLIISRKLRKNFYSKTIFSFFVTFFLLSLFNPLFFTPHGIRYFAVQWWNLEIETKGNFLKKFKENEI